jgi:hypothetical protein
MDRRKNGSNSQNSNRVNIVGQNQQRPQTHTSLAPLFHHDVCRQEKADSLQAGLS